MKRAELCVVALGGNAIIPENEAGTINEQRASTQQTMSQVADQISHGISIVLTHGNGPIVGNIALRNAAAADEIPPMPLDVCGADSQGGIGYMIQQSLQNELSKRNLPNSVVSLVTQVEVDPNDSAFENPTKPIGPFYAQDEVAALEAKHGWTFAEDSGRGYRRVVPSPAPKRIVEIDAIRALIDDGVIVNCVGGGGIPVVRKAGQWHGLEAVIDKDHTAAVLARQLHASRIILLTGVEVVSRGFGSDSPQPLYGVSLQEVEQMLTDGEFPPGSMGPKIRASLDFLRAGGREVIITNPEHLSAALMGKTGTHIAI